MRPDESSASEPLMSAEEVYKGSEISGSTAATMSSATPTNGGTTDVKSLQKALEEANNRDATAKAALAKSDAVILELRASVRQHKKQIEKLTLEKEQSDALQAKLRQELDRVQESAEYSLQSEQESHEKSMQELKSQLAQSESQSREAIVGELQVQLDRAHAQILTSDMVRKELEDTLEAEQYTWELRVQDQERTISTLQQECRTLREDLEHCRSQWKEAEDGWTRELQELQSQMQTTRSAPGATGNAQEGQVLQERLELLEQEREELQACLDEAMQELEAVDQELRQAPTSGVEPLQHLYRWLLERSEQEVNKVPGTVDKLVEAIQLHIESIPSTNLVSNTDAALKVAELEAEISVFRGDIKARDESNAELRTSLKEAVALLKPLQDAVAKSEQEKQALQEQVKELSDREDLSGELDKRDQQIESLQEEVSRLEKDLSEVKQSSPSSPERTSRSLNLSDDVAEPVSPSTLARAREDLKAKRESERALQQMLKNAQGRFHALHKENHDVEAQNHDLRDRVKELEEEMERLEVQQEETLRRNIAAEMKEATVKQLEQDTKGYQEELQRKEDEVVRLEEELALAKERILKSDKATEKMKAELEELRESSDKVEDLEGELSAAKNDLEAHKQAETVLTKSLKQAVGLLRPLETHLETSEQEKRDLQKELKTTRKKLAKLEAADSESRSRALSLPNEVEMSDRDLEGTVRELEQENDKLQNALEEVSQNLSATGGENDRNQARLRENLVELNSRYEVTQNKLERAVVENHALIDALKHKESDERKMEAELRDLREDLMRTNHELQNAKYIATSALMKVEELTMANVEQISSLSRDVDSPRKRSILERVRSIEKEVDHASKINKSLEMGSLEDRERIVEDLVHSLTSTPQSSAEMIPHGQPETQTQPAPTETPSPQSTAERKELSPTGSQQQHSVPITGATRRPPQSLRQQRRPDLPPWASPDDYD